VFVQNSRCGSRFNIYNSKSSEYKHIMLKNILCFNLQGGSNKLSFEYFSNKKGIGIIYIDRLIYREIGSVSACDILCGICGENLVIKRGNDILLHNIDSDEEKIIASNHHITSLVTADGKYLSWLQPCKNRPCVVVYDIESSTEHFFSAAGNITRLYISGDSVVFQNSCNDKCSIWAYNIKKGTLEKCFENENWIDLYKGSSKAALWTVKKECGEKYVFDVWVYNLQGKTPVKVLSDYNGVIIPAAANKFIFWVDENIGKCNAFVMFLEI
jgi:hypothetical protein